MKDQYPSNKYSKSQVGKAGQALASGKLDQNKFEQAMDVLSWWRYQHEQPLEHAYQVLKSITKKHEQKEAIYAKRLKRKDSIARKLIRFQGMSLKNMQDLGGCRVILPTQKKVDKVVRDLRKLPNFKNDEGQILYDDYIHNPKPDGYRSYHLKGRFPSNDGKSYRIEIQIRTILQHSWATALEIVDLFTGQALKSNSGKEQWQRFFAKVSNQFSYMEDIHLFEKLNSSEKFNKYSNLIKSQEYGLAECIECQGLSEILSVQKKFEAYAQSLRIASEHILESKIEGYVLVEVDANAGAVRTTLFTVSEVADAENMYIDCEKKASSKKGVLVALVSSSAIGGIKEAYPNFFADSTIFMQHLDLINQIPTKERINRWARALESVTGKKVSEF